MAGSEVWLESGERRGEGLVVFGREEAGEGVVAEEVDVLWGGRVPVFSLRGGGDGEGFVGVVGGCCDADVDCGDFVGGGVGVGLKVAEEVDGEDCHEGEALVEAGCAGGFVGVHCAEEEEEAVRAWSGGD